MKPLKVIQLIDSLSPGGAEMMAVNIANTLAEKGIESHLCATRQEGDLKPKLDSEVGYLFLNKKSALDLKALKKLVRFLKSNEINTIHAHATSYFTAFLIKLWLPKINIIWHNHYGNSKNISTYKKYILKYISYTFKMVISVNSNLHQWGQGNLKAKQYKYLANFASFSPTPDKTTKLLGINGKRVVCLANLRQDKDHLNLLKAFRIVIKKQPSWTLHLVGLDLNDAYGEEIKFYIKNHCLNACVFLYGSCTDTQHILGQASIGVLASKSEGLPVALLEYGLAKLPVAVTDVGECSFVVGHMNGGLVVPPKNEERLAAALIFLIENEEKRKIFGENLYNHGRLNYSKNAFITQLITLYKLG